MHAVRWRRTPSVREVLRPTDGGPGSVDLRVDSFPTTTAPWQDRDALAGTVRSARARDRVAGRTDTRGVALPSRRGKNGWRAKDPLVRTERVRIAGFDCIGTLRTTADGRPICPVCDMVGMSGSPEGAREKTGEFDSRGLPTVTPSWDICPGCGTQFGLDDTPEPGESLDEVWAALRRT